VPLTTFGSVPYGPVRQRPRRGNALLYLFLIELLHIKRIKARNSLNINIKYECQPYKNYRAGIRIQLCCVYGKLALNCDQVVITV
jgi:hypothetical protein